MADIDIDPDEHGDFREYVKWKVTPKYKLPEGAPETQKEWAEAHGYSPRTLSNWNNTDAFDELTEELAEEWLKDSIPGVVATAREVAHTPDASGHNDRKMLLEMAGEMGSLMTIRHEGEVEHTHTLEEARTMDESALREAMRQELRSRPQFAEASDDQLDSLIDAFAGASGDGALPESDADGLPSPDGEIEDAEAYVVSEPSDPSDINMDT